MLVVKIELHSAITGDVTEIGRMHVWNDGTGTKDVGNYGVGVLRKGDHVGPRERAPRYQRTGDVKDYPRLSYNVWRLVCRALRSAFPEEK